MRVATLTGDAIRPHMPDIAALRITVFREWPYLYEGDAAYESRYLARYSGPRAAVIAAFDEDRVVGAATCLPVDDAGDSVRQGFADAGIDTAGYFYFGESVLLPEYRGRGIGVAFFKAREAQAAGYRSAAFCAVARAADDPRRPADYRPLHDFWHRRGYREQPGLACEMTWRDVGDDAPTPHRLDFWSKALQP